MAQVTERTLGRTALRIVGVYLLVQVLVALPSAVRLLSRVSELDVLGNVSYYVVVTVAPPLVLLCCAVLLLFGSEPLSRWLFPADGQIETLGRKEAEAIAFAVAGLWILGCSIPGLTGTAESMISPLHKIGDYEHVQIPWKSALAYGGQAVLGLVCFLQAGNLARWWDRRLARQQGEHAGHVA
jgi:hypothetical protein